MIPLKLKLYKAKGILEGIKQSEIEIDFTKFSPGLVVIFGASGTGKSTIQQNMHPFRSVGKYTFKEEFETGGYREFEFEYNKNKYISKIYESKASLFKNEELINRNKKDNVTDYDFAVEQEFGDYDTFLKLAYGGRSFANLVQLGNVDMKSLFVDYLLNHLAKYEEYEKKLKLEYDGLSKELTLVTSKISVIQGLENKAETIKNYVIVNEHELADVTSILEKLLLEELKYKEQENTNKKWKDELNELMQQRINANHQLDILKRDLKINTEEYEKVKEEWIKLDSLKLPEAIEINVDEVQETISENNKKIQHFKLKDAQIIARNETENNRSKHLIEKFSELEKTNVPCDGKLQLKCPLTGNTNYEEYKEYLRKEIEGIKYEDEITSPEIDILEKVNEELNIQLKNYNEYLKVKSQLDRKNEIALKGKEYRDKILPGLTEKILDFSLDLEQLNQRMLDVERAISNELTDPTEQIQNVKIKISALETSIKLYKEQLLNLEAEIISFKALENREKELQNQINEYPLLFDFFGKNGGMVFEIEKAGEEVSRIANELLRTYHNKNIQVKFETLRPSADGKKLLEVFDVMFSCDGSDWKRRLSEGEMVIASTALREAMNYLKQDKTLKSLMVDELDGSLDVNARVDYLKLLEEGHALNGRTYTFLISHMTEIQDRMMQQIHLHENSITLKY